MPTASLARRLAAMMYDSLLLVALYFVLTAVLLYLRDGAAIAPGNPVYLAFLVATCWAFHVVFWRRGGRTLGMQSWRLRLVDDHGNIPPTPRLFARLVFASLPLALMAFGIFWIPLALFALGYVWVVFDRDGLAWHDRLSATRPVVETRRPRSR